eukprot:GEMP01003475.1.p1 GENE.GEMP01003475.1~~GEMP01003475.1.p1  ORF type:complete len:824 (+),score=139.12 GEMP01003475.1:120-2591(+)
MSQVAEMDGIASRQDFSPDSTIDTNLTMPRSSNSNSPPPVPPPQPRTPPARLSAPDTARNWVSNSSPVSSPHAEKNVTFPQSFSDSDTWSPVPQLKVGRGSPTASSPILWSPERRASIPKRFVKSPSRSVGCIDSPTARVGDALQQRGAGLRSMVNYFSPSTPETPVGRRSSTKRSISPRASPHTSRRSIGTSLRSHGTSLTAPRQVVRHSTLDELRGAAKSTATIASMIARRSERTPTGSSSLGGQPKSHRVHGTSSVSSSPRTCREVWSPAEEAIDVAELEHDDGHDDEVAQVEKNATSLRSRESQRVSRRQQPVGLDGVMESLSTDASFSSTSREHSKFRRRSFSWEEWMVPTKIDAQLGGCKPGEGLDDSISVSANGLSGIGVSSMSMSLSTFGASLRASVSRIADMSQASRRSHVSVFGLQNSVADYLSQHVAGRDNTEKRRATVDVGSFTCCWKSLFHQTAHMWTEIRLLKFFGFYLRLLGMLPWYPPIISIETPPTSTLSNDGSVYDDLPACKRWKLFHLLSIFYMILIVGVLLSIIIHACLTLRQYDTVGGAIKLNSMSVNTLIIVAASLFGHCCCIVLFASNTYPMLIAYACRNGFIQTISSRAKSVVVLVWLAAILMAAPLKKSEWYVVLSWGILFTWAAILLSVMYFCSLGLDAFALVVVDTQELSGLIQKFNVLNAVMRKAAYAVQFALTGFATVAFSIVIICLNTVVVGRAELKLDAVWAGTMFLIGATMLVNIAMVNTKCLRLPALVHSLNFGAEINHDKWCVAAHIKGCDAGFFIYNMSVSPTSVMKFSYIILAASIFVVTQTVEKKE